MPRGRRTTLRPIVFDAIVQAVREGASLAIAAKSCGIPEQTAYGWREHAPTGVFGEFQEALEKAEAERSRASLRRIERAAEGGTILKRKTTTHTLRDGSVRTITEEELAPPSWQADAWYLERRENGDFGRPWRPREESVVINDSNVLVITPEQAVIAFRRAQATAQALPEPTPTPEPQALDPQRNGSHS